MSIPCSTSPSAGPLRRSPLGWPDAPEARPTEPEALEPDDPFQAILAGESLAVRRLRSQVERIAPYFRTALVRGEPGSGKRLVARAIHSLSPCAQGPFVVSSASAVAEAVSSEANAAALAALFDSARGGTLYLENVGELSYALQTGFLRFLAGRDATRVSPIERNGFLRPDARSAETRIVAATHRDLRTFSSVGQFRADLYTRLSVVEIFTPPLRQRAEDLGLLAEWLLRRLSRRTGLPARQLSPAALAQLVARAWSTNLREFEQVVTHAAALTEGLLIEPQHLLPPIEPSLTALRLPPTGELKADRLQDVIQQHVIDVLTRCGGNKLRAAELLGISRSTLYRMLDAGPGANL